MLNLARSSSGLNLPSSADSLGGAGSSSSFLLPPPTLGAASPSPAQWKAHLQLQQAMMHEFKAATKYDPNWHKAWHAWAVINFEALGSQGPDASPKSSTSSLGLGKLSSSVVKAHLVPAVQGFFRSIALAPQGQNLQDILRLLTLWFEYGSDKTVEAALQEGFSSLSIDFWLPVIPQIIARIHSPSASVRRLLSDLLTRVGQAHPQALVYPLTVASKVRNKQIHKQTQTYSLSLSLSLSTLNCLLTPFLSLVSVHATVTSCSEHYG